MACLSFKGINLTESLKNAVNFENINPSKTIPIKNKPNIYLNQLKTL